MRVGNVRSAIQIKHEPRGCDNDDRNRNRPHPGVVENSFVRKLEWIDQHVSREPYDHPPAKPFQCERRVTRVVRVNTQETKVIANPDDHGDHRGPAKPSHRARHQRGVDLSSYRRVELLHRRKTNEIEKIEQADPDDSEDQVKPAKNDEFSRASTFRKTEMRSEGAKNHRERKERH